MRRGDWASALLAIVAAGCASSGGEASQPANLARAAATDTARPLDAPAAYAPLRRLSRTEFDHAVLDLLGVDAHAAAAFPPDETVAGFEANSLAPVTQTLVEQLADAAESIARSATLPIDRLAPCSHTADTRRCAVSFVDALATRAYRRPLDPSEREALLALYDDKARDGGHAVGVRFVIEAVLQAPSFLYRPEPAPEAPRVARPLTGHELATRLAFFVWASPPDDRLLDDASHGKLDASEGMAAAARRLLADPRAGRGARSFVRQWLGLDELETASKDGTIYPAYSHALRRSMVEETLRFGAEALLAEGDGLARLLTSPESYVDPPLARLYGVKAEKELGFVRVALPSNERAGVLTRAGVLSVLANPDQSSPIRRGKFVRERLLCQPIPPPPPGIAISTPKFDPKLSTRERFAQHRTDRSCSGCHAMMDPIGFGFEHYDAIGGFRAKEGSRPIDATGELSDTADLDGRFDGAIELSRKLATSGEVRRCFATQWFRYALARNETEADASSIDEAHAAFERGGFDVRELVVAIAASHAFRHVGRAAPPGAEP